MKWAKFDAAQKRAWQYAINVIGKHTGRSQYDVARFLAVVYTAGTVPQVFNADTPLERWLAAGLILVASVATVAMFWMANHDERAAQRGLSGMLYGLRDAIPNQWNRMMQTSILGMAILLAVMLWRVRPTEFAYFAMWGYWYVMICDPPPPPQERETVENPVWNGA